MKQKTHFSKHLRPSRGFTLVELLVVIVIIAVLVAVGFPLARNAKAAANRTQCMSRLREWGVAFGSYAAEHDGKIEWRKWPSISWGKDTCSPYVDYWAAAAVDFDNKQDNGAFERQLYMRTCPSQNWKPGGPGNSPLGYATIRPTDTTGLVSADPYPLAKIKNPSRFMLMIEAMPDSNYSISGSGEFSTKVKPLTVKGSSNLRHTDYKVNALFGDYSVNAMSWRDVEKGASYWTVF